METVGERARRTGKTVGAIYQQLRSGRIPGALKVDGETVLERIQQSVAA